MNLITHFEKFDSYIPISLSEPKLFLMAWVIVLFFIVSRYFLLVGVFYFLFWKNLKSFGFSDSHPRVLHNHLLRSHQISYEIKWSMISSLIFAFFGVLMGYFWQNGMALIYLKFNQYGMAYLFLSLMILSILHEIYFYLTHLWMHKPAVFKHVHFVHHFSIKTSPWASFSFHPIEAVIQAAFLPLAVLIVPLHPTVIIAYLLIMTLTAISNHLGFELIGSKRLKSVFISGSHHSVHHEKFHFNYGLYYTWIDKIFGTEFVEFKK